MHSVFLNPLMHIVANLILFLKFFYFDFFKNLIRKLSETGRWTIGNSMQLRANSANMTILLNECLFK